MLKLDLQHFGGRGASSAGGSSKGAPRRSQTDHMNGWNPPPSPAEQLAKANGISLDEAARQVNALSDYSGSDYRDIRYAQYNKLVDSDNYKKAQDIENFIAQSPVWAGGELYRGVRLPLDDFNSLTVGSRIDMKGMSSWSSSKSIAEGFSNTGISNRRSVVFRTKGTKQGASITHLSMFGKGESEVLVSGKATWTIKKITTIYGRTYVDVEEN